MQHSILLLIKINQKDSKGNQHNLKQFFFLNGEITEYTETPPSLEDVQKENSHSFEMRVVFLCFQTILLYCIIDNGLHTEIER